MRTLFPECPGCGNAYNFRQGGSQGCACKIDECEFGYATTYIPEIILDSTIYKVFVEDWGIDWKRALVKIALKLNISVGELRKSKNNREYCLVQGYAQYIFHFRSELNPLGLILRIEPEFPYDIFDINLESEWSLSNEEIKYFKEGMNSGLFCGGLED